MPNSIKISETVFIQWSIQFTYFSCTKSYFLGHCLNVVLWLKTDVTLQQVTFDGGAVGAIRYFCGKQSFGETLLTKLYALLC